MAEETVGTRIRWDDAELHTVALEMVRLEKTSGMSELEAVRIAQQRLPVQRQREIKTWSVMQPRLQPKLDEIRRAQADLVDQALAPTSSMSEVPPEAVSSVAVANVAPAEVPPPITDATELPRLVSPRQREANVPVSAPSALVEPLMQAVQSSMAERSASAQEPALLDPLMVEASLIAALQSPAVLQALEDSFSQAMAKSFAKISSQVNQGSVEPPRESAGSREHRVLLAGFSPVTTREIETALQGHCEVRVWKPHQGLPLFQTLTKVCRVAVIPEEMDEDIDQDLRARNLVVIRHSGSASKLVERLDSVFS